MSRTTTNPIASALRDVLVSPNVSDANLEPANVVDVLDGIATAITGSGRSIAQSIENLAVAVIRLADAVRSLNRPED